MLINFDLGPYVHALGWTTPDYRVQCGTSSSLAGLPVAVTFSSEGKSRRVDARPFDEMLAELPGSILKASGVPRARSASKSAVFAGLVAKELVKTVADVSEYHGDRMGVAVVSSSAIVPIFWRFESVGVSNSWRNTDTMLLPASIPSAVGTAVSMVTDTHATSVTFGDGAVGMCQAIEHAYLSFLHDRSDYFMLLGAEEAAQPMGNALLSLGDEREVFDGCSGVLLSAQAVASSDWQIAAIAWVQRGGQISIAEPWASAIRVRVAIDGHTAYTSQLLPCALHTAMLANSSVALVEVAVAMRGAYLIALRRQSGPRNREVFA